MPKVQHYEHYLAIIAGNSVTRVKVRDDDDDDDGGSRKKEKITKFV